MTRQPAPQNTGSGNAVVYVDYENISDLLKRYGKDPLEMDFFRIIQRRLRESGLKVVDFIVYSNFEKKSLNTRQQTMIRAMGIQTRQASNHGKNSGDLELTVDALRVLYKIPAIDTFVIISSDRDIIPLLKAIKFEAKVSYVLSTRTGFNQIVAEYADFHTYIEDIFGLTGAMLQVEKPREELSVIFDTAHISEAEIARAREVSRFLYSSQIWERSTRLNEPVSLGGYVNVLSKVISRFPGEIVNDFKVAHYLKYVSIYEEAGDRRLYIKQGEKREEFPGGAK